MTTVDFTKQPIKVGDYVACLDKSYQTLNLALILRITDKTILVAKVSEKYCQGNVVKAYKANKEKCDMYHLNGACYRTIADAVVLVPKAQLESMDDYTKTVAKDLADFVIAYDHYRPDKEVKTKADKSKLKI